VLDGRLDAARAEADRLEAASAESSSAERAAMEAERAMLDLKKAEFMLGHLLEPGPGTIVAVVRFGAFVELDAYPIEGLVRAEQRPGDRRPFRIGERVLVEATEVSLQRRRIDLRLLERLGPRDGGARSGDAGVARRGRRADKRRKGRS
jgi:ribonuclease R